MDGFSGEVTRELKNYVYRLIDPRDGSTFYVGRGTGNRVFAHVGQALKDDKEDLRLETIRKIHGLGLKTLHVIHRHGMTEDEAKLAEAVLIDAYPGLTNIMAGEKSSDYGPANAEELVTRYGAPEMEFEKGRKIMVIKTKWWVVEERGGVYEAVRASWVVSEDRAGQADYVLAIIDQICRGVYIPKEWKKVPTPSEKRQRWEFDGREADAETWKRYYDKRIPGRMRRKGMASPVLYEGY